MATLDLFVNRRGQVWGKLTFILTYHAMYLFRIPPQCLLESFLCISNCTWFVKILGLFTVALGLLNVLAACVSRGLLLQS